jgi:phage protein D
MTRAAQLPDLVLRVNGSAIPDPAAHDVRALTVEQSVGEPSSFSVELSNWDAEKLQVSWSDGALFAVGNAVEILMGYLDDLQPVLTAEITSLEPVFSAARPPVLTVGGYDHAHRLARTRRSRSFLRMKDSAIAQQIGREAGLKVQVTDTKVALPYVAQANQTDWAFLRERAGRIGYEVFVRDKVLHFRPPDITARSHATLSIGREVTEFRPRLSAVGQVGEVTVRGWDVKKKEVVVGRGLVTSAPMGAKRSGPKAADAAFGRSTVAHVDLAPGTKAEADQIASGVFDDGALGYLRATAECGGNAALHPGAVVEITDAGTRFSGPYYVVAVTHTLDDGGFRTSLTLERNGA